MERKCEIIFSWYTHALNIIFEGVNYSRQNWIIDTEHTNTISYERISISNSNGGNRTRKCNNMQKIKLFHDFYFDELYNKPFAQSDFTTI